MALTEPRNTRIKYRRDTQSYKVAEGETIYEGAIVAIDSGYLVPAADTADFRVVGIAAETVDNADGDDGDESCRVDACVARVKHSGIAQANVGVNNAYVSDDGEVQLSGDATNDVLVGMIREIDPEDSDFVWCEVGLRT